MEEWEFAKATDAVAWSSGSQTVTGVAADFGIAFSLVDSDGEPLAPVADSRDFYAAYLDGSTGTPEAFTVVGSTILVGPTPSKAGTATLYYRREATLLSADGDTPAFPAGFHFALVHGAAAEGLKLQNDPTWQAFEQDFQASITAMQRQYVVGLRAAGDQFGAYRPGGQWA